MKITVIKGSPRKNGGSNILVSEFVKGVKDFGAEIFEFDAHNSNVNFCVACNHCGMGESHCIFKDDFEQLKENLLESSVLVFATPVYYFGFSAQIKKIIDRFYGINAQITEKKMKSILITSQHSEVPEVTNALKLHYASILKWLNMENVGMLNAIGVYDGIDFKDTPYLKQAYELGNNLRF